MKKECKKRKIPGFEKRYVVMFAIALLFFSLMIGFVNYDGVKVTGNQVIHNEGGTVNFNTDTDATEADADAGIPDSEGGFFDSFKSADQKEFGFGGLQTNLKLAQYIVFLIIAMLLFWLSDTFLVGSTGSKRHGFVRVMLSLMIAYLFVAFIRLDQLYSMMAVYSAAGATITVGIPFVVIYLFNSKDRKSVV